jgi:hypothetical protein
MDKSLATEWGAYLGITRSFKRRWVFGLQGRRVHFSSHCRRNVWWFHFLAGGFRVSSAIYKGQSLWFVWLIWTESCGLHRWMVNCLRLVMLDL